MSTTIDIIEETVEVTRTESLTSIDITSEQYDVTVPSGVILALGDARYEHNQAVPASTWTVNHNLGKIPAVAIVTNDGVLSHGRITHISTSQLTIEFNTALIGKAYCN